MAKQCPFGKMLLWIQRPACGSNNFSPDFVANLEMLKSNSRVQTGGFLVLRIRLPRAELYTSKLKLPIVYSCVKDCRIPHEFSVLYRGLCFCWWMNKLLNPMKSLNSDGESKPRSPIISTTFLLFDMPSTSNFDKFTENLHIQLLLINQRFTEQCAISKVCT